MTDDESTAKAFDPYHTWVGIPPEDQPPNCHQLPGIRLFETEDTVIQNAAERQTAHPRTFRCMLMGEID